MSKPAKVKLNVIGKDNFTLVFPDGVCGFANTRRGAAKVIRNWAKDNGIKTTQVEVAK